MSSLRYGIILYIILIIIIYYLVCHGMADVFQPQYKSCERFLFLFEPVDYISGEFRSNIII